MTRERWLLVAGLALVATAVVGGLVTGPGWGTHMGDWHHSMMGEWGHTPEESRLEGAEAQEICASVLALSPTELTVTAGEPVDLTLQTRGAVPSDLAIVGLDVEVDPGPGQRSTVGLVPPDPGVYPLACSYQGHAAAGMGGTLAVLEP